MGMMEIDLSNYKDKVGQRVPPGRYRVIVEDTEQDVSNNQNPMIVLWLRVLTPGPGNQAMIIDRLTQSEKALFRTVNFMQAIGLPTPKKRLMIDPDRQFRGKVLDIDVEDGEPYRGTVKSEVRGYMPASKDGPAAEPVADLADLPDSDELDAAAKGHEHHGTPANPGVGGFAEFAPDPAPSSLGASPATDPRSSSPQAARNGSGAPVEPVAVTVPDDIDLNDLDL